MTNYTGRTFAAHAMRVRPATLLAAIVLGAGVPGAAWAVEWDDQRHAATAASSTEPDPPATPTKPAAPRPSTEDTHW